MTKNKVAFAILGLLLCQLLLLTNSRFTVWPEMILYPWLLNHGYNLYQNIINPYFPLLPLVLGLVFHLFGSSVITLKVFSFFILLLNTSVILFCANKITKNDWQALLSGVIYVLLSYSFGGNGLWFELFLTPFVVLGLTVLYIYPTSLKAIFLAGICIAIAVFTKQNALFFIIPAVYMIWVSSFKVPALQIKKMVIFFLPFFFLSLLLFCYLYQKNILEYFWNWVIILPLQLSKQNGFLALPAIRQYVLILFPFLSLLALPKLKFPFYWISIFLSSVLFAFPRYEDFHLQTVIAFSALLAPLLPKKYIGIFLLITFLLFARSIEKNWNVEDRFLEKDMFELSEKIKGYPSVYLLNSPELAYFYSQKLPPKIWAITFPWYFENFDLENAFVKNLKAEEKDYIVTGNSFNGKFGLGSYVPEKLMVYIESNYIPVEQFNSYTVWQKK